MTPDGMPKIALWAELPEPTDDAAYQGLEAALPEWAKVTGTLYVTTHPHPKTVEKTFERVLSMLDDIRTAHIVVIGGVKPGVGSCLGNATSGTHLMCAARWRALEESVDVVRASLVPVRAVMLDMESTFKGVDLSSVDWDIVGELCVSHLAGETLRYLIYPFGIFSDVPQTKAEQLVAYNTLAAALQGEFGIIENTSLWNENGTPNAVRHEATKWVKAHQATFADPQFPVTSVLYTEGNELHWPYRCVPYVLSLVPAGRTVLFHPHAKWMAESVEIVKELREQGYGV